MAFHPSWEPKQVLYIIFHWAGWFGFLEEALWTKNISTKVEVMTSTKAKKANWFLVSFLDKKRVGNCLYALQKNASCKTIEGQQFLWVWTYGDEGISHLYPNCSVFYWTLSLQTSFFNHFQKLPIDFLKVITDFQNDKFEKSLGNFYL